MVGIIRSQQIIIIHRRALALVIDRLFIIVKVEKEIIAISWRGPWGRSASHAGVEQRSVAIEVVLPVTAHSYTGLSTGAVFGSEESREGVE